MIVLLLTDRPSGEVCIVLGLFILLFRFKPDMNRGERKTRRYTMPQDETCLKTRKREKEMDMYICNGSDAYRRKEGYNQK